jgi:predicted phosphohydrolase
MKIKIISDLHLEFTSFSLTHSGEDILILAGDISSNYKDTIDLVSYYLLNNKNTQVIFILGNHDYYNKSIEETHSFWKNIEIDRFHYLQDSSIIINGFRFYGTTLWTDMDNLNIYTLQHSQKYINDYKYITGNSSLFTPEESYIAHINSKTLLSKTLNNSKEPVVVITHHLPSFKSISPKYSTYIFNGAFASNLDHLVKKAHTWIHGHTHSSISYKINNTKVICNPRGYISNNIPENPHFDPSLLIEL